MAIHALEGKCKMGILGRKHQKNDLGVLSTKSESDIENRLVSKDTRYLLKIFS